MVTIQCLTYNQEAYIRDCLEGFVMQKANFRFEAIVHDDASTDGTADIIREYAEKYPDIIKPIFEAVNQYSKHDGSLQRIMDEHTHGKYIAYCEGDDYWIDSLKLQRQVDFMESNPEYGLVRTNVNRLYQDTKKIEKDLFSNKEWCKNKDTYEDYILRHWFAAPCTWLWRTDQRRDENLNDMDDCFTGDLALILAISSSSLFAGRSIHPSMSFPFPFFFSSISCAFSTFLHIFS